MTQQDPAPLTRRDIHRRPPGTRRELRRAEQAASRRSARRRRRPLLYSAVAALTAGAVVTSGLAQAHSSRTDRIRTTAAAAQLVAERQARAATASSARLTGQAESYAREQREEALDLALTAMESADQVVQTATPVLTATALTPLDEAVADLTLMVETLPETLDTAAPSGPVVEELVVDPVAAVEPDGPLAPAGPEPDGEQLAPERIVAAAELVTALSAEVKATADVLIAEAEAREAAAAETARKVAVAVSSPNGEIPTDVLCDLTFAADALLRCDAAAALSELNDAYRAEFGTDLRVVSSYRSYAGQVAARSSRGSLAAAPGTSNHGRGVAVDLGDFGGLGQFGSANYRWMAANAGRFGWYHPAIMQPGGGGPQEPWHWEYDGDA